VDDFSVSELQALEVFNPFLIEYLLIQSKKREREREREGERERGLYIRNPMLVKFGIFVIQRYGLPGHARYANINFGVNHSLVPEANKAAKHELVSKRELVGIWTTLVQP